MDEKAVAALNRRAVSILAPLYRRRPILLFAEWMKKELPVHSAIESMLAEYSPRTADDHISALKEIIQEIALLGLYREGFFKIAAFYGGTALRIFHRLDRFSEDLDFSLITKDSRFDISPFTEAVRSELGSFGLEMSVEEKTKRSDSAIKSAFIKGGTQVHLLKITSLKPPVSGVHPGELIKIKLEVDTDPPPGAEYDIKYHLVPIPFSVRVFDLPSLFAGKVHALLCGDGRAASRAVITMISSGIFQRANRSTAPTSPHAWPRPVTSARRASSPKRRSDKC